MGHSVIGSALERIHQDLLADVSGEVASYIPELAVGDPDRFGIAVATVDGHVYATGDALDPFTIQSISKPFVYGMALDDHGVDHVLHRVGVEPSGDAFNSIVMDERNNRPLNPMVNAGAIASTALVRGTDLADRQRRVRETFGRYAGRELGVDRAVFESERRTGHRNRAIAYLELNSGMIEEPVDEHLDLYFEQCSIEVTASDLALMAATLANGGVNPVTGERALRAEHVTEVLTVMATCGMYDWSGEWMYRVGLPAKSGVGGGIIAVLPGQVGIGTFAPRLDEHGNSARGIRVCEELGRRFRLHLLDTASTAAPVVQRRYDAAAVASNRIRPEADRALLDAHGSTVVVLELQGDLYFATAERLVRAVEDLVGLATAVVLDARRVRRATAAAARLLVQLRAATDATGLWLRIAAAPDVLRSALASEDPGPLGDWLLADTDTALEQAENDLLERHRGPADATGAAVELHEVDVLRGLGPAELDAVAALLRVERYAPDEVILREGDRADRLCLLVAGSATVRYQLPDPEGGSRRVRTFTAGTAFGQAAVLDGGLRTATVVADGPADVRSLSVDALATLAVEHPTVHAHLLVGVAATLQQMLVRAMAEVRALQA